MEIPVHVMLIFPYTNISPIDQEDVEFLVEGATPHIIYSCDQDPADILSVINNLRIIRDYHGIIMDCPVTWVVNVITKVTLIIPIPSYSNVVTCWKCLLKHT
jgi:hypothetical protein